MKYLKWLGLVLAILAVPVVAAYAIDRLFLAPDCPDCHTEATRALPLFDGTQDGLVRIQASTMEFRARAAGFDNAHGDGVILLHGFPETSVMWEPLLGELGDAGYRAIAFDQRGYSPDARPSGQKEYTKGKIASDVLAVADAAGFDRFHVIGHDFGGIIGWTVADRHPKRVLSLTSLSTPHPLAIAKALSNASSQWPRSSYVLFYWLPLLPELALGFDQAALLKSLKWRDHTNEQVEEYRRMFSEPGALHAALNWYRAFKFRSLDPVGKVRPPTLFIWGREDPAFSRIAVLETANFMDGAYRLHPVPAGHNLLLEEPKIVTADILAHLDTATKVAKQWAVALNEKPQDNDSPCDQAPPKCLRIVLSPNGGTFRIRNRCDDAYKGVVRISCSGWAPDAAVEYRFSLGAETEMAQESTGLSNGTCYYRHRLCAKKGAPPPQPRPAALFPF
ncbi:MAG: alpha/beta fold hydrolase [Alphaproteobacteria bacterium]|jgi:pimeloyl-ACP methyl ester carboxylesterase|uniref:alpha/beta fold hydrolase n=1 Tax=Methyloceanibacter sp. TaxID=1965321 RepID=UPI0035688B6D